MVDTFVYLYCSLTVKTVSIYSNRKQPCTGNALQGRDGTDILEPAYKYPCKPAACSSVKRKLGFHSNTEQYNRFVPRSNGYQDAHQGIDFRQM